ncbi:MAG: hypothetical protein IT348_15280 [Candidatus Eisenbacteria bacterium]|nr:hypothetical protein [Candidatus Eisenbacteria bacterium]
MNRKNTLRALAVGSLMAVALVAGCRKDVPLSTVKSLLDDPGQHDKKTVHVAGETSGGMSIMGYGAYMLDDGTGRITIVTKENGAPRDGAKVGVEGEFRSAFTLGIRTAAVIIESERITQ